MDKKVDPKADIKEDEDENKKEISLDKSDYDKYTKKIQELINLRKQLTNKLDNVNKAIEQTRGILLFLDKRLKQ